jgi:hypothetical protein
VRANDNEPSTGQIIPDKARRTIAKEVVHTSVSSNQGGCWIGGDVVQNLI